MKRIFIEPNWKESWKYVYPYDLLEVYGDHEKELGYSYAYENRRNYTLALISKAISPGSTILDVAAAQGNFSLLLAERGYKVTWNDIRADLAEYVQMKYERGAIVYKPGNVFEISFDHLFDLVLATEIIEHVAHPDQFLQNLSKLIKPDGFIVITTPLGSYFRNNLPKFTDFPDPSVFESTQFGPNSEDHVFLLHLDEIKMLSANAGLEVRSIHYYSNPLTHGHIKLNRLLKYIPKRIVFIIDRLTQKLPGLIGAKIHTNVAILLQKKDNSIKDNSII